MMKMTRNVVAITPMVTLATIQRDGIASRTAERTVRAGLQGAADIRSRAPGAPSIGVQQLPSRGRVPVTIRGYVTAPAAASDGGGS
jgi:hypothetical protein